MIERNQYLNQLMSKKENGMIKVITGIGRCCKFTNPQKISDTFASVKQIKISDKSVARYLDYFIDAFVLSKAHRYDIKGRRYIGSPLKYYYSDIGWQNARLNFRLRTKFD